MDNRFTIVVVNDFDYIQGGASKIAIQTANMLANEGYNVYYFSGATINNKDLNDNVKRVCTNQGEALRDKNKLRGFKNGIYNSKAKKELKKLLLTLDKKNTVVHVHGWTKVLSSSVFDICFKLKFKVVLTMHDYFTACPNGGYFNYKKNEICHLKPLSFKCCKCNCDSRNYLFKLYRILRQFVQYKVIKLNKKITDVIAVSEFSSRILKDMFNQSVKLHIIYNPIEYENESQRAEPNKSDYYIYVGRVSPEKGVDIFCEAITDLNLNGLVVGDGPDLPKIKKDLYQKYNINDKTKILLYAPTFRADMNTDCYNLDINRTLKALSNKNDENWICFVRLHPNISKLKTQIQYSDKIINMSEYPDLNELMIASSALITDYSSLMFDYSYMKKPIFIYANDIKKYNDDRGFSFDLYSLPFDICENNDVLERSIIKFKYENYLEKLNLFFKEIGLNETGNSSEIIAKRVLKECGINEK